MLSLVASCGRETLTTNRFIGPIILKKSNDFMGNLYSNLFSAI